MANIRLFLLLPQLFLLLVILGQAAPLPNSNHPSCLGLPQPSRLGARAEPGEGDDPNELNVLEDVQREALTQYGAIIAQVQELGLQPQFEQAQRDGLHRVPYISHAQRNALQRLLDEEERLLGVIGELQGIRLPRPPVA
ncbi:hypothetical protein A4X06_0g5370 [Tilletia controversa]|uniref:Uncharacterized protein n=1 Tax=Tilletia controversa TaxID=13291 RepID=A0A8X7SW73_9BASI|nr:hypothetical protein CF328_g4613 [Tilletia controversa]KAE8245860.1 hypothetical protein A4X06_0g5370 [Tilletia controversa]